MMEKRQCNESVEEEDNIYNGNREVNENALFTEPVARVMEITISRGEVLQPSTVGSHGFDGWL
jgi:hypothetical protein